jgi:hypothetical protein
MQYSDGSSWRAKLTPELEKMGVTVFDPYKKPFIKDVQEADASKDQLLTAQARGDYEWLQKKVREIRSFDLNLVDRSDFIVAHIEPKIASWGSSEELVTAVRMKKPIFLSVDGGKKATPLWIFGMIPHEFIYDSVDDILARLQVIDSGSVELDSNRWRLLRKEYR